MAKKFLTKAIVLITIALIFSFCKKDEFSISAKKVVLTETVFEQSVLRKTGDDEFTLMGYNNDQKLVIIKYNTLLNETDSKAVDVPSSFALTNFLDTEDGYVITSQKLLTKINNTNEIEWTKEPTLPIARFGNSLMRDDNGDVWLSGDFEEEKTVITQTFPCLLKISNDGNISLVAEYNIGGSNKSYIDGIYESANESLTLLFFVEVPAALGSSKPYYFVVSNIKKDGSENWEANSGALLTINDDEYFIIDVFQRNGPYDPQGYVIYILGANGETINYERYSGDDWYPTSILNQGESKVVLFTKNNEYRLNFYDNEGVITKTSSLSGAFQGNSIRSFSATSADYVFFIVNDNGNWLYSIPKNQF